MSRRISPTALKALEEALASVFWFRSDLRRYLENAVEDQDLVRTIDWQNQYKRESVGEFLALMRGRQEEILNLMIDVASMSDFRRLARLEDGDTKVAEAKASVAELKRVLKPYEDQLRERQESEARIADHRDQAAQAQSMAASLETLRTQFFKLHAEPNPQKRGLLFEVFLRDLFKLFDLVPRSAFKIEGEQIDGSFKLGESHFLLEAKWQEKPCERHQLDAFESKIAVKIENTLGLFISFNGFIGSAVSKHSSKGTRMILMDGADLMAVLESRIDLVELLQRKHRHAAESGEAFLPAASILA